jgi:GT2 family glycosyltransferase
MTVVVVNWNGAHLLSDCLGPLTKRFPTVVVDNASTDVSVTLMSSRFPEVQLIVNDGNAGFSRANNQGIERARTDYVLLLNNDTIPDVRAIDELAMFLDTHPVAGIVGPTLVNVDGSRQDSCGPGPNLKTELLAKTMLHRLLTGRRSWSPVNHRKVDWVTGAALCIRRDLVLELGGLDEGMFMFYEDLDLCARAREAGHEVWFVATPPIVHLGGATRRHVEARSLIDSYRSTQRYFAKHGPAWRRRAVRAMTVPEVLVRSSLWAVLSVTPGRRPLARERLCAYREILRLAVGRAEQDAADG